MQHDVLSTCGTSFHYSTCSCGLVLARACDTPASQALGAHQKLDDRQLAVVARKVQRRACPPV